jgi:hypothetical protein
MNTIPDAVLAAKNQTELDDIASSLSPEQWQSLEPELIGAVPAERVEPGAPKKGQPKIGTAAGNVAYILSKKPKKTA